MPPTPQLPVALVLAPGQLLAPSIMVLPGVITLWANLSTVGSHSGWDPEFFF